MRKRIIILLVLIIAVLAYNYIYRDHRDISKETAEFSVTASNISNTFSINPEASEEKYLNKTIEVSGTVSETTSLTITLNNTVFCQFKHPLTPIPEVKTSLIVKGRFIGYDDLLEQVKLDQCTIIN